MHHHYEGFIGNFSHMHHTKDLCAGFTNWGAQHKPFSKRESSALACNSLARSFFERKEKHTSPGNRCKSVRMKKGRHNDVWQTDEWTGFDINGNT